MKKANEKAALVYSKMTLKIHDQLTILHDKINDHANGQKKDPANWDNVADLDFVLTNLETLNNIFLTITK